MAYKIQDKPKVIKLNLNKFRVFGFLNKVLNSVLADSIDALIVKLFDFDIWLIIANIKLLPGN